MIKQCKGKDLTKVPKSKLQDIFYQSIKYDGHYVQIHKTGDIVRFFTSGGKEFYLEEIARHLLLFNESRDFILEAEYIYTTDGKLGSRGKAAKLTTYRTDFAKGIPSRMEPNEKFKVFDVIVRDIEFTDRLRWLDTLDLGKNLEVVEFYGPQSLQECIDSTKGFVKRGYEGTYLKSPTHIYQPGKRVNDAIKLKLRPTADLLCIDVEDGEGKYTGMIGSLVLQDSQGRIVRAGSGLSDNARKEKPDYFIGKVVEIEYEQILDTYIQPTLVGIRFDKTKEDID